MANIQTTPTVLSTEISTTPATKSVKLTSGAEAIPGRAFMVSADGNYAIILADDTAVVTLPLAAGVLYPFSVKKFTSAGNSAWNFY